MTYIRPSSTQITAWATSLGNDGWTWDNLWPYFLKSESFTTPTKAQLTSGGASYIDAYHGRRGPVNVAYQYALQNGSFAAIVNATWQKALGIPFNPDVNGGELRGFFVWPQTMDRDANVRDDAARAYYLPIRERGNLVMLRGRVGRIIWADAGAGVGADRGSSSKRTGGNVIAEGVQYTEPDGSVTTLYADKEVILSAGSVRSPAILELSGVGNPECVPFCILSLSLK
ncbi:glucose-methanol-choline oxidoreductase [Aspergillus pseudoustus]|uniref:glucose oxidase n=1 Tax=Aspergillus pseudoustus TaxID=1810923 RepID=A0ABR4JCW0_9EURO